MEISERKWKQIRYIFDYLINEDAFKICPNCEMPYRNGYCCSYCGCSCDDELCENFTCEE